MRSASARPVRKSRAVRGQMVLDESALRRLRRARLRKLFIGLGLTLVISVLGAAYLSPVLRVQHVEVAGARAVSDTQIAQLASFEGHSMLRLDGQGAEERIAFLPMIKSAVIERDWPNTVRITVTERVPWAYWQVGANSYVIDEEGVVLSDVVPPEGAPIIQDLSNPVRLVAGDHVDADAVSLAQKLLQQVPQAVAQNIAGFEYSLDKGLTVLTEAGYRVVMGDSQNMAYKLAVWKGVEGKLGQETMSGHVLDVRFEQRPSYQ